MRHPDRPTVTCVVGARPNFMKIKPIVDALSRHPVTTSLVHTGQHYDAGMSEVFFRDLALAPPDVHLEIGQGTQAQQVSAVMVALEEILAAQSVPGAVVVVGDVSSTLGAALAAAKSPALLVHVEAGLRSGDWSMPEEVNRIVIDRMSDLLCATSDEAVRNLLAEGCPRNKIELVGDVMVETLHSFLPVARKRPIVQTLGLASREYVLVTVHRQATVDDRDRLRDVLETLDELASTVAVVFPVHPRTRRRIDEFGLRIPASIMATEPLGYLDFIGLQAAARFVITDSGSVQAEAESLGLPCLTMRDTTERHDTLERGANRLVGTDRALVLSAARELLACNKSRPTGPVGPVGERIVAALMARLG